MQLCSQQALLLPCTTHIGPLCQEWQVLARGLITTARQPPWPRWRYTSAVGSLHAGPGNITLMI